MYDVFRGVAADGLVARAASLATPGTRRILGIAGAPGSGKSTLAAHLAAALGPGRVAVVGMDGFHLSNEILRAHSSLDRKGAIDTFDGAGFAALLERLAAARCGDGPIYAPRFDRTREESVAAAVEIRSKVPLVITEGNYLLAETGVWPRARACMAEVWFLEVPDDVRRERLIARHEQFGKSADDARAWALGPDEANARLIRLTASAADVVIPGF